MTAVRFAILHGSECWAVKRAHEQKIRVAEMRIIRWMCGQKMDRLRSVCERKSRGCDYWRKIGGDEMVWIRTKAIIETLVRRCETVTSTTINRRKWRQKNMDDND